MDAISKVLKRDEAASWLEQIRTPLSHAYKATEHDLVISIKENAETRRHKQNSLLWLWNGELAKHIFETQGSVFGSDDVHEFMVRKLLPVKAVTINNELVTVRAETKKLSVKQFADYLNRLEHYAREHLGAKLTNPDDLYWDALMREIEQPQQTEGM